MDEVELDRINAIAEIAASRTDKYYIPAWDLLNGIEPLPQELCFEDRVARFVWLEILNDYKLEVGKQLISNARTDELRRIDLAIVEINKQLTSISTTKGKRDTQIDKILKVIGELGLNPLNIPEGKKQEIKEKCIDAGITFNNEPLFTDSGFKKAWEEANKREVISMENKEKYLTNQNAP